MTYAFNNQYLGLFLLFFPIFTSVNAQELIPYRQGSKWGLADSAKKIYVKCIYEDIGFPENGKTFVRLKSKIGLIDRDGKEIIDTKYKSVGYFHDGLSAINLDGKYGYANEKGEVQIPCKYEFAGNFNKGYARAKVKGKWGLIDEKGNKKGDFEYEDMLFSDPDVYYVKQDRKWGAITYNGEKYIPCQYDSIGKKIASFRVVRLAGKYGLLNLKGVEVIPCHYDEISDYDSAFIRLRIGENYGLLQQFSEEVLEPEFSIDKLAEVREKIDFYRWRKRNSDKLMGYRVVDVSLGNIFAAQKEEKWALLDTNFKQITAFEYDSIKIVAGHFGVKKLAAWGIYHASGQKMISFCRYSKISDDRDGKIEVCLGQDCGLIDTTGSLLVASIYNAAKSAANGLYQVALNGRYGLIDQFGSPITPFKYQGIESYGEEYALLQTSDNKTGLFDYKAAKIVIPTMFDELSLLRNQLIMVKSKNEYGLMDIHGKLVNHLQYSEMEEQANGRLKVKKRGKIGWLDSTGRQFIPCKYDSATAWYHGYIAVKLKEKWGMIDSIGKIILPFEYQSVITPYWLENSDMPDEAQLRLISQTDRNLVWIKGANNFWGLANIAGKVIVNPRFDSIFVCNSNKDLFITKLAARYGLVNSKDEEILGTAYSALYETENGFFIAQQGTKFALIGADGQPITSFKYQEIQYVENDKYLWVLYENQRGLIDLKGNEYFEKENK